MSDDVVVERRLQAFGARLRALRERSGSTGRELARVLGWAPSKVSKIETGSQAITEADLAAWLDATGAPDKLDGLSDELGELRVEYSSWRRRLRGGYHGRQEETRQAEDAAALIRAVEVGIVPGQVQIPDYARWILQLHAELQQTPRDLDEAVAARMARQAVLYDPTKQVEILIAEAALRYPAVPPAVMRAQLDRLGSLIGLPTVRFGLLPLNRRLPYMPLHGYLLIDNRLVWVENLSAEITISDPDEVAVYATLTDRLWAAAVERDDARALLSRIAADLAADVVE